MATDGWQCLFNTLRPRQNGRHFADDIFKCIFLNENVWIPIKISMKFVPKGPINNIPALVQIIAWRRPGNKPLSEPMMVVSPTHICVTRPHELSHGLWPVPSHHPSQWWLIVNCTLRNQLQWYFNQNKNICEYFKMLSSEWWWFCSSLNVLRQRKSCSNFHGSFYGSTII